LEKHFKREGFVVVVYRKRVYDSVEDEKTGKLAYDTRNINEKNMSWLMFCGGIAVLSMEVSWR